MNDLVTFHSIAEITSRVCDIAAEQLGIPRREMHGGLRLIQDLHCDSLAAVELLMEIEDEFDVELPNNPPNLAYKAVFTRDPIRVCDLAELVYLQQGAGHRRRKRGREVVEPAPAAPAGSFAPFTHLDGALSRDDANAKPLHVPLGRNANGFETCRRRNDGMICVLIPAAQAVIGSDAADSLSDERPPHRVQLTSFLIDVEPVSTTAYCRFLNSIPEISPYTQEEWFLLPPEDRRKEHQLIRKNPEGYWAPLAGAERLPMVLVSWHGANAYSLWANGHDWLTPAGETPAQSFLPSEAQWEYAARGAEPRAFPWGDAPPTPRLMRYAQYRRGADYSATTMPLAAVNEELGLSPFGLRHMAGNVWQWCRDWYSPDFYRSPIACEPDVANREPSRIRSERGGSWIGSESLCRSSYRRGRVPSAKGRCLGFRCCASVFSI